MYSWVKSSSSYSGRTQNDFKTTLSSLTDALFYLIEVVIFLTSPRSSLWNINEVPSDLTRFKMNICIGQIIA